MRLEVQVIQITISFLFLLFISVIQITISFLFLFVYFSNPSVVHGARISGLEARMTIVEDRLCDLDARGSEESDNLANERELDRFIITGELLFGCLLVIRSVCTSNINIYEFIDMFVNCWYITSFSDMTKSTSIHYYNICFCFRCD